MGAMTDFNNSFDSLINECSNTSLLKLMYSRLQELEKENQKLKNLVNTDSLTQIANRRYFDDCMEREWRRLRREFAPLSLIFCDIDCFKNFNDTYGHKAGDSCLRQVAKAIEKTLKRPADLAARYGGEEFAIILPNTDANGALKVAEKIRQNIKALAISHINSTGKQKIVTVSLGVACIVPRLKSNPAELFQAADDALYESKKRGRDRVTSSSVLNYQFDAQKKSMNLSMRKYCVLAKS
jgi:diguanylate cyclase (GGDEF)-like protein